MPYYGDYYRGDYYRGDPFLGGVGKFLGKAVRGVISVGRAAIGLPPPTPAQSGGGGSVSYGEASGYMIPTYAKPPSADITVPAITPQVPKGTPGGVPQPGVEGWINRFLPGGQTGYLAGMGAECGIKGFHANKSAYFTRGGGTSKYPNQVQFHPAKSMCVKNRHMNVTNPKALRRAIRRSRGAIKLLRKAATSVGYSVVTKASLARRPKARRR